MQGKSTTKTTFDQLFEAIFSKKFGSLLKKLEVDKYVKKLTALKFIILIAFAQLEQLGCLREISISLHNKGFSQALKLNSISFSQVSRKLRSLMLETVQALFQELVQKTAAEMGFEPIRQGLGRLYLIDSSVISLCFSRYRWADFRKTKSGIKLHLRVRLFEQGVLPDAAVITPARKADKTQMNELVVEEEGAFNVFDRAYLDYKKFDHYCQEGIRFASRLKKSALVEIMQEFPIKPGSVIKNDRMVILGKEGITKMHHPLRLIETVDSKGKEILIITNDFNLDAEEIADIYRYRWQIEIFFKWIKQHLCIKHLYSTSQHGVEMQLYIALISYCLLKLTRLQTGYQGPLLNLTRIILTCLHEPFAELLRKLSQKPRKSKGRRKLRHEQIFQETLRQVMAGEADHLDDLTYDPVIL